MGFGGFGMVFGKLLLHFNVLAAGPPGREIAKCGGLGHLGLGRPLALRNPANPGPGPKTGKHNFLAALFGGESGRPKGFSPGSAQLFLHFTFGPPGAGNR